MNVRQVKSPERYAGMETSLHRQLKAHYAADGAQLEQRIGRYRIDVIDGDELIEIQLGSLSAIRDKIAVLVKEHQVRIVKPIIARKYLVKQKRVGGEVVSRRRSPKQGTVLDLFEELVHFTRVFPHPRLVLEVRARRDRRVSLSRPRPAAALAAERS